MRVPGSSSVESVHRQSMEVVVSRESRRVGVAVVGLGGAVATTAVAGLELVRIGAAGTSGLPLAGARGGGGRGGGAARAGGGGLELVGIGAAGPSGLPLAGLQVAGGPVEETTGLVGHQSPLGPRGGPAAPALRAAPPPR